MVSKGVVIMEQKVVKCLLLNRKKAFMVCFGGTKYLK